MFSRPVVTEGQAPALIFANWHEPEETLFHELLERSPAVAVPSEQAYERATRQTNIGDAISHAWLAEISSNTLRMTACPGCLFMTNIWLLAKVLKRIKRYGHHHHSPGY